MSCIMHCYKSQGYGSCIISPISGAVIDFLGKSTWKTPICLSHTQIWRCKRQSWMVFICRLMHGRPVLTVNTGGAINPDKAYEWVNGIWRYRLQPEVCMTIPLPNGTRAPISPGHVATVEKFLGCGMLLMATTPSISRRT